VTEIEIKAHVAASEVEAVKAALERVAVPLGSFEKRDVYWRPAAVAAGSAAGAAGAAGLPASGARVRRESRVRPDGAATKTCLVTFKAKEVRDGVEVNDEREFAVSRPDVFEDLLTRLGLAPGAAKTKRGWAFARGDLTAELAEVGPLGWFVEIEILGTDDVEAARGRLLGMLAEIGVDEAAVEGRYYTEMLAAR